MLDLEEEYTTNQPGLTPILFVYMANKVRARGGE